MTILCKYIVSVNFITHYILFSYKITKFHCSIAKFIEKFTLETTASNESQLLPISKLLNEFSVVHSTGFCQISNKVLYEVYCEADKDRTEVKKQIEKYLNDYTETEYSWDKVPIKKV